MHVRFYLSLFLVGLLVFGTAAAFQQTPGYMDAEYYYAGALRLARGESLDEPYLWNYLNDPPGLPAPAFAYWMPLVSLMAAAGLKLGLGWWGARLPFLLLAACVPVLSAYMAWKFTGQLFAARLAGVLALFPGFYLAYLGAIDAFALYMVLGGLFLLLAFEMRLKPALRLAGLGLLAGLMHLARADGLLWLGAALGAAVWQARRERRKFLYLVLPLAAYGLVMAPWYGRNLSVWGALFPPGNGRTLWLVEYGQTMIFPAGLLNFSTWVAAGWGAHLAGRLEALGSNLQTVAAVQGGVVLFPFMLIGAFKLRRCLPVALGLALWALTLAAMSLIFPYAGQYGGFFHSGAAFQPLWWALAPVGLEAAVRTVAVWRRWQRGGQVLRFQVPDMGDLLQRHAAGRAPNRAVGDGRLTTSRAREVFAAMIDSGEPADAAMARLGIAEMDDDQLAALCRALLAANPNVVAQVKQGKTKAIGALVGQAKRRDPNVHPGRFQELCLRLIETEHG